MSGFEIGQIWEDRSGGIHLVRSVTSTREGNVYPIEVRGIDDSKIRCYTDGGRWSIGTANSLDLVRLISESPTPGPKVARGRIKLTRRGTGKKISRRVGDIVGIDCDEDLGCTVHLSRDILGSDSMVEEVAESMDSVLAALPDNFGE